MISIASFQRVTVGRDGPARDDVVVSRSRHVGLSWCPLKKDTCLVLVTMLFR